MEIRSLILAAGFVFSAFFLKGQDNPNIILIVCDDLAAVSEALGGDNQVIAPNFQRLANEGVTFKNAFANVPVSGPSRASLFTGIQPFTSGFYGFNMSENHWNNFPGLSSADPVFLHFKNNGYNVYGTGLTFLQNAVDMNCFTSFYENGNHGPFAWDGVSVYPNGNPVLFGHPAMPPALSAAGQGIAPLSNVPEINGYQGWIKGNGEVFNYTSDEERDKLSDELAVDYALGILNEEESEPFFLTIGFFKPHAPFYVPDQYFALYPLDQIQIPGELADDLEDVAIASINNRWSAGSGYNGFRSIIEAGINEGDEMLWIKKYIQGYYATISFIDHQLGLLLDALEESPHAENTYLVFTSDNGFHVGQKTLIQDNTLWDQGTAIPLMMKGPGLNGGEVVNQPVSLIDIYPTLVDFANIPLPASHDLDGNSMKSIAEDPLNGVWEGENVAISSTACNENIALSIPAEISHQHYSLRSESMRYILYSSGEEELYSLQEDPNEWFNLSNDPAFQDEKNDFRNQLANLTGILLPAMAADTSILFYGDFEQNLNGWRADTYEFLEVDAEDFTEGGKSLRIISDGDKNIRNPNLKLLNDSSYTVIFDAKSNVSGSLLSAQITRNGEPDYYTLVAHNVSLTDEWQTYSFSFSHEEPTNHFNSRIKFDFLSSATYHLDNVRVIHNPQSTGIPGFDNIHSIEIFPNPSNNGMIFIKTNPELLKDGVLQLLNVFSQDGSLVYQQSFQSGEREIKVDRLSSGVYFFEFITSDFTATKKVVVY